MGVFLSSMPVNWAWEVAIRDLSLPLTGAFQSIGVKIHYLLDLIPSPCVVFDLAPFS